MTTNDPRPIFDGEPLRVLDPGLYSPCGTCGMPTHPDFTIQHECPEPLPYEQARYLVDFYASSRIPISSRLLARIRMGLAGPSSPPAPTDWSEVVRLGLEELS